MRSESLSWHKTWSFTDGPMLTDTQWRSIVHRPMQELLVPTLKEIFLITWPRSEDIRYFGLSSLVSC